MGNDKNKAVVIRFVKAINDHDTAKRREHQLV